MKKYESIYQDLRDKIETGQYPVGAFLPTENEIAELYNASRGTVRVAEQLLESDGLIKKVHGHGSRVLEARKLQIDSAHLTSFSSLLERHQGKLETTVLTQKTALIQEGEFGFSAAADRPCVLIERIRSLSGERVIFDRDYFLVEKVGARLPEQVLETSVYEYLEGELGLRIGYAHKDITVERPDDEVRLNLDLSDDSHVVVTNSLVYLENAALLQVHTAFQRVDTFHLIDNARYRPMR
ncbi:MAG TPA: UTRA domain-containing protein [Candidatus Coprousia avicola]|nr:UTRA domain-containing protein [Candidatus Coprousia avicola]